MKHWQAIAADRDTASRDVAAYCDFQEPKGTTFTNRSQTGVALDGKIVAAERTTGRWPGRSTLRFDGAKSVVEIPSTAARSALDAGKGCVEISIELWLHAASRVPAGLIDKSSAGTAVAAILKSIGTESRVPSVLEATHRVGRRTLLLK